MPTPAARDGGFQPGTKARHVGHGQEATLAALKGHDLPRDIATIESGMGGGEAREPAFTGSALFLLHHIAQASCQIALDETLADFGWCAAGQENRCIGWPARIFRDMRRNTFREQRIHGKTFRRVANGILRHIAKAHGAMAFQSRDPGIRRGGHHGAAHALRNLPAMFAHEDIRRQRRRPMAKSRDCFHLPIGQPDHDGRNPGHIHQIWQQHPKRYTSGAPGIHRVAARFQHCVTGRGRQIMPRRNRMARTAECGTGSGHG